MIEIREDLSLAVSETSESEQSQNLYVAPGLIDNQINGYKGLIFLMPVFQLKG